MLRRMWWAGTGLGLVVGAVLVILGLGLGITWLVWAGALVIVATACLTFVGFRSVREAHGIQTEEDVSLDDATASSRPTGGVSAANAANQHSTTGPTPNDTWVGRVAGEDTGSEQVTGAEARSSDMRKGRD